MSTFLIAFAVLLSLLCCSTVWCCLAISSAARDDSEEDSPVTLGDYWTLHRNGDYYVVVAELRGQTFAWSYRRGFELMVMNTIWHHYELGLLTRDEVAAIGEMVARGSLTKVSV